MRRFGQHATLKPEKRAAYIELHANVWPEVLQLISDCHLSNYSIYLMGDELYAYFEYTGSDYEADMKRMDESGIMQAWWKHTKPCFLHHERRQYYADMHEIFHLC